jgi:hypothetical protein
MASCSCFRTWPCFRNWHFNPRKAYPTFAQLGGFQHPQTLFLGSAITWPTDNALVRLDTEVALQ